MKIRWIIAPAALFGITFALTACGGDDTTASSTSTGSGTTVATGTSQTTATHKATSTPGKTSTPKETPTPEGSFQDESTPQIDECALVTPSELGLLANDTFGAGTLVQDTCTFTGSGGVVVTLQTFNLGANAKDLFESGANIFSDDILNAPGDEAYYDTDLGLSILQGNLEMDIYVNDPVDSTRNRASAFAVSDVALANLPT